MNTFPHIISLYLEIVVPPPPLRKAGQAESNHRYQESKFILCKQIFHLVISMCSISCFTSFQSQLMLIPTFIVFLIPLRTYRREERQAGFSIHVCADNSQLDSIIFSKSLGVGNYSAEQQIYPDAWTLSLSPEVSRMKDLSASLVCWYFSKPKN